MVTVEAAIALASIVAVLAMAAGGLGALLAQISAVDAAREAARSAAVSGAAAGAAAGELALGDRGGEVRISRGDGGPQGDSGGNGGGSGTVVATVDVAAPGLPQSWGLVLTATATASIEPGSGP